MRNVYEKRQIPSGVRSTANLNTYIYIYIKCNALDCIEKKVLFALARKNGRWRERAESGKSSAGLKSDFNAAPSAFRLCSPPPLDTSLLFPSFFFLSFFFSVFFFFCETLTFFFYIIHNQRCIGDATLLLYTIFFNSPLSSFVGPR